MVDWDYRQLNIFWSDKREHAVTSAWSDYSVIKTFVSAAFLISGGMIVSIKWSSSFAWMFSRIMFIVNIEFFAICDLKLSTCLINSFITGNCKGWLAAMRCLWYNTILLIMLQPSHCFYQSPLFKASSAYCYYFSGFIKGSSIIVYKSTTSPIYG